MLNTILKTRLTGVVEILDVQVEDLLFVVTGVHLTRIVPIEEEALEARLAKIEALQFRGCDHVAFSGNVADFLPLVGVFGLEGNMQLLVLVNDRHMVRLVADEGVGVEIANHAMVLDE